MCARIVAFIDGPPIRPTARDEGRRRVRPIGAATLRRAGPASHGRCPATGAIRPRHRPEALFGVNGAGIALIAGGAHKAWLIALLAAAP